MATKYAQRRQPLDSAYRERRDVADRAQRDDLQRNLYNSLLLKRAALKTAGVMQAALPDFNHNSAMSDLAAADAVMTKLSKPAAPVQPSQLPRSSSTAPRGLVDRTLDFFKSLSPVGSATPAAPLDALPATGTRSPLGNRLRQTGAGWEAQITKADGTKKWVAYTPTFDESMDVRTGGAWAGLDHAGRAAELRKLPMPLSRRGVDIAGPSKVYIDPLGNISNKPGSDRTLVGINQGGPVSFGNDEIRVAPGAIVGGAGITPVAGGTLSSTATGRQIVGGQYQTPGSVATSTFSALPAPASRPTKSFTSTDPGTNLKGPASSTGVAYQTAPRPPVPMPATSAVPQSILPSGPIDATAMERRRRMQFSGFTA